MTLDFRFAVISDPHIALPATISTNPTRFHMSEVSIPAFEVAIAHLASLKLDFLLLPGDLTQHGEPENHQWLVEQLSQLPYPVYVVPGNHDIPQKQAVAPSKTATEHASTSIGLSDFPALYQNFGYTDPQRPYYTCNVLPGVRLIGLNSNQFDAEGNQIPLGQLDEEQLQWLENTLAAAKDELLIIMVHHNVLEHFPGQAYHPMGRRYMVENASSLLNLLQRANVQLIFTGHLHVQDVVRSCREYPGVHEITTGSLVSYPHPYRLLHYFQDDQGRSHLQIQSRHITQVPGWPELATTSREWMGDRSLPFMQKLLSLPPLSLPPAQANQLAPSLRYFWADIAQGDSVFDFPHLPEKVRRYLYQFSALNEAGEHEAIDNQVLLSL